MALTEKLGKIRLQYHLSDKAWLLPPNMRAMARFMNLAELVRWAQKLIGCFDSLDEKMKEAYSFILQYRKLIAELDACVKVVRFAEITCKRKGFSDRTNAMCQKYIINNVIGNASNRQACAGIRMLDYFKSQELCCSQKRSNATYPPTLSNPISASSKPRILPTNLTG